MREHHKFRVMGRGEFPMDMLRYDAAWPADTESAMKIAMPMYPSEDQRHDFARKRRVVTLYSAARYLTEARWASFGWTVLNEALVGHESSAQVESVFNQ